MRRTLSAAGLSAAHCSLRLRKQQLPSQCRGAGLRVGGSEERDHSAGAVRCPWPAGSESSEQVSSTVATASVRSCSASASSARRAALRRPSSRCARSSASASSAAARHPVACDVRRGGVDSAASRGAGGTLAEPLIAPWTRDHSQRSAGRRPDNCATSAAPCGRWRPQPSVMSVGCCL